MENNLLLNNYGRLYNPPNWFYNPNYLINRIYYICSGTAYYQDTVQLKPGHFYIFKASPSFQVSQSEEDPVDHIFFDFISTLELVETDYIEVDASKSPKLKGIIDTLMFDYQLQNMPVKIAESYANIILYELQPFLKATKAYSELTTGCLKYIHSHNPADLSVAAIADDLNININHLIRTFKKETGVTPLKYISMIKAEVAIEKIREGRALDDIALMLGYSTVSALSVFFKSTTKRNLSEFRI